MNSSSTNGPRGSPNVVVDIIETLAACGLECDEYQLYDSVDVDALEQILASSSGDVEVQFTVEGIRLAVRLDGVDVLIDEQSGSEE